MFYPIWTKEIGSVENITIRFDASSLQIQYSRRKPIGTMETERELNAKILAISVKIQQEHPELSELLGEMPITIPDENNPEINVKVLNDYYESLQNILKKYD